ncbi:dTMP kinase [Oceanirhabdus sp. W0125-5]|uniref:dTMP kinase n=1 Tax=Oceanirhabdus sp. W0125-5 TaxID=2999116 RepID=UPI0022F2C36A|nr:dTMP kinase [Oceanirhabdus sp. W0125-5]WBW99678.1 dTMP kinase [Oceanirhabdus sp. W0125-5]
MMRGLFITLEGGEGCGKTTQIELLNQYFKNKKINFINTREPGGIDISEQIREVILNKDNTAMDSVTEAMLYAASRRQHMIERVIPALESGVTVLCDRFVDASLVYQGYSRGIGIDQVMKINEAAIEGYMPDLTIYLDIEPTLGLERIHSNENREINRLDLEGIGFHEKVREGYMLIAKKYPERIKTVDASGCIEDVHKKIVEVIEDSLKNYENKVQE